MSFILPGTEYVECLCVKKRCTSTSRMVLIFVGQIIQTGDPIQHKTIVEGMIRGSSDKSPLPAFDCTFDFHFCSLKFPFVICPLFQLPAAKRKRLCTHLPRHEASPITLLVVFAWTTPLRECGSWLAIVEEKSSRDLS